MVVDTHHTLNTLQIQIMLENNHRHNLKRDFIRCNIAKRKNCNSNHRQECDYFVIANTLNGHFTKCLRSVCLMYWPVTGAGDQQAEQVVDDEGEDDSGDGSAGDGVARILKFTWEAQWGHYVFMQIQHAHTCMHSHMCMQTHKHKHTPDMLEPAIIPVQPLNITAKTVAKVIIFPVV